MEIDPSAAVDPAVQVIVWAALAFCLWLALSSLIRRLRVPNPGLVAAPLSWVVARLFIWIAAVIVHEMGSWFVQ